MTEVKAEGNILNPKKYPEIKNDTLNFILPCHNENQEKDIHNKLTEGSDREVWLKRPLLRQTEESRPHHR